MPFPAPFTLPCRDLDLQLRVQVQIKFEAVLVTVAVAEEEDALRDFTNKVHISALNKKTRRNEEARARLTT